MLKLNFVLFVLTIPLSSHADPCKGGLKKLLELYTNQNKEMMITRLENASDKHKFLRSFIPIITKGPMNLMRVLLCSPGSPGTPARL